MPGLLICPSDTQAPTVSESWPHPSYLPDKLGLDRKTRQCSSLALCAGPTRGSFLPDSGVWGDSHNGTHFGITVNSRQPPFMCRHGLHHPYRCVSGPRMRHVNVPSQPPFNSSVHSLVVLGHLQEIGTQMLFSSAMNTDPKDAWPSGSILMVSRVSPTFTLTSGQKIQPDPEPCVANGKARMMAGQERASK